MGVQLAVSVLQFISLKNQVYMKPMYKSPRSGSLNLARRFNAGKMTPNHPASRQRRLMSEPL
jgi:hypothetical protein